MKEVNVVKKILLTILIAVLLLTGLTSCKQKDVPVGEFVSGEVTEKISTAYVDWFGAKIDLSSIKTITVAPNVDGFGFNLAGEVDFYEERQSQYAVLRVECTGDLVQKVGEHLNRLTGIMQTDLYMEIPFRVCEVLEGDSTIVNAGEDISIEFPGFFVSHKYTNRPRNEWENDNKMYVYYRYDNDCLLYPRIGYEYVIIVVKENENSFVSSGFGVICELLEIDKSVKYFEHVIENQFSRGSYERRYKQVMERYNIEIKG